MVVRVARQYHEHRLNYCIITFYDPQRAAIIRALENDDLPSDCVYNVDSFQGVRRSPCFSVDDSLSLSLLIPNRRSNCSGNEADYVILSSVRTQRPGFLKSQPRMNVALTRCRKGMVVVTDKNFLQGKGRKTLLGQLCRTWSKHYNACWKDRIAMLNNSASLPGLPAPSSRSCSPSGRATTPRRSPSSQARARARARTHNGKANPSTLAASVSGSARVIGSGGRTTKTAVRRDTR